MAILQTIISLFCLFHDTTAMFYPSFNGVTDSQCICIAVFWGRLQPTQYVRNYLWEKMFNVLLIHTKKKRGAATELCKFPEEQWKQITIISLIYSSLPSDVHSNSIDKIKMQSLLQRVQHRFFYQSCMHEYYVREMCTSKSPRSDGIKFHHIPHFTCMVFGLPVSNHLPIMRWVKLS